LEHTTRKKGVDRELPVPIESLYSRNRPELDLVRGSDNGRCGERGVAAVLVIAQMTTPIRMPMVSYLSGPRTGAQDSSAQLEGLGAVASRRLQ
jgi:hypothetical protein